MKIPRELIGKEPDVDVLLEFLLTLNKITNIIWQSQRETFKDCELITEQITVEFFSGGYIKPIGGKHE